MLEIIRDTLKETTIVGVSTDQVTDQVTDQDEPVNRKYELYTRYDEFIGMI